MWRACLPCTPHPPAPSVVAPVSRRCRGIRSVDVAKLDPVPRSLYTRSNPRSKITRRARARSEKNSFSPTFAMDVLFAFTGDKFAVVVSDTIAVQQIIVQKDDMEKIMDLDSHKVLGLTGPKGDCVYFGEYVQANMKLYELRNGAPLSTRACAHFVRTSLADALRSGPYQVNVLLAGYDKESDEASLYFMDPYASMMKVRLGFPSRRATVCKGPVIAATRGGMRTQCRAPPSIPVSFEPMPFAYLEPTWNPRGTHVEPTSNPRRTHVEPTSNPPRTHLEPTSNPPRTHLEPTSNSPRTHLEPLRLIAHTRKTKQVNSGGHGYGGMFSLSLFDKHWVPDMSREAAAILVDKCIAEVKERLVTAPSKYHVKIVDKDGTHCEVYDCAAKAAVAAVAEHAAK